MSAVACRWVHIFSKKIHANECRRVQKHAGECRSSVHRYMQMSADVCRCMPMSAGEYRSTQMRADEPRRQANEMTSRYKAPMYMVVNHVLVSRDGHALMWSMRWSLVSKLPAVCGQD